jgi:GNAT superfamily N-acetyltransferase
VLEEAQEAAVERSGPGSPPPSIDAAARDHLADAGYGERFIHRTGHGIGVEEHEEPWIVAGNDEPLEAGMAFSVEPGIYVPGRYGARIEDIVVVTDDGVERVNHRPRTVTRRRLSPTARRRREEGRGWRGRGRGRGPPGPDRGDPPARGEYKREQERVRRRPVETRRCRRAGSSGWRPTRRREPLGYAAGTLRPTGCTIGPVFTRANARRRGVGEALLTAIQEWAEDTRVPVVEISVAADNEAGQRLPRVARLRTAPRPDVADTPRTPSPPLSPRHATVPDLRRSPTVHTLPEEQRALLELVDGFAAHDVAPRADRYERAHEFPRPLFDQLGRDGPHRAAVRPEVGGSACRTGPTCMVVEELSRAFARARARAVGPHAGDLGDRHPRHRRAARAVRARPGRRSLLGAYSLSEPGSGSDAAAMTTRAVATATSTGSTGSRRG